ncbi:uncharacterized protein LOC117543254 isoform X1 [Gymnodraco acuticeps]|uniref:Uncharacterized protein LOC117543254 isoform X1 n=1 Tax=Gymnodraco acuticeps TaxID=8218 RepID=A0A6P8TSX5_GYMAC|nr:uncharacterized protein LOC117543254 isoform X1 [Gymnodraco acuticeps]
MADNNNTDRTEDDNMDNTVASGGSMMVITVKTPNGKEDISISEDSSVSEIMDNLFGRCGVGSAPPGTLVSTPLLPTASQPSTTLPCASEAQPGPSMTLPTTLPCASEAQPGPSMTLPTTLPCASEGQPGPSMTLPTTQPRSIRSRVSHPSFYDLYEAHSERRTSALETLVRPEQERRRRLKERNRRRFEAKMLTAMGEVVSQLKSIGSQQERIIELLQDKPNMP